MSSSAAFRLRKAADIIEAGGLVAHPTEAVWGLACSPWNTEAIAKLLRVKRRPLSKGLILIGRSAADFSPLLAPLAEDCRQRILATWPGANTWVLPDPQGLLPPHIRGVHSSVAVRVSDHPLTHALCEILGGPIVSTSANITGRPSSFYSWQVRAQLGDSVDYYLHGETGGRRRASTIRDALSGETLRS